MGGRVSNLLVDCAPISEFQRQIVLGATQFCRENREYRVRTISTEMSLSDDPTVIDGVIAMVDSTDPQHRCTRFGKPVVNVSTIVSPVPFPTVTIENRPVGRMAAEHLIGQGYRSFAYHMESRVHFSKERFAGFADRLSESGYTCSVFDTFEHIDAEPDTLHAKTLRWLMELPKPLGLFTHNDQRATVLVDLCRDGGLIVPEQVGIMGTDNDSLLTQLCEPGLTSVDTGASLIGYRAAHVLVGLLQGKPPPLEPIYAPPKAVVARGSTAPSGLSDPRLRAAVRFIHDNATLPLSVEEISRAAGCSRRSLERLFLTQLGRSPAQEIRLTQINQAKWLLVQSDRSLAQVSERCGYASFRNFATAFRREVGISAGAYRKKFRRGM